MTDSPVWIAERSYDTAGGGRLNVAIAVPRLTLPHEWSCAVRIWDDDTDTTTAACGSDALQALLLGLSMLRIRLETSGIAGLGWVGIAGHNIELVP